MACKSYSLNVPLLIFDRRWWIIATGWFGLSVVFCHPLSVNNIFVSSPSENWQMDWQTDKLPHLLQACHNMNFTRHVTTMRLCIVITIRHFALSSFLWVTSLKKCVNKLFLFLKCFHHKTLNVDGVIGTIYDRNLADEVVYSLHAFKVTLVRRVCSRCTVARW